MGWFGINFGSNRDEEIALGLINDTTRRALEQTGIQEARKSAMDAWDRVEELTEECNELSAEVKRLRAQSQLGNGESRQDREDRLTQTNNNAWAVENHALKEQLSRSKALNRTAMINNEALLETIRHLKGNWHPDDPKEGGYKDKMNPLIEQHAELVRSRPNIIQAIDEKIEAYVNPKNPSR